MSKIYRITGKEGRTTIPFAIRMQLQIPDNSLISYEVKDNNTIIIHREKTCDGCKHPDTHEGSILDVINSLSKSEQKHLLKYLTHKLIDTENV